jgi:hypothetical protein
LTREENKFLVLPLLYALADVPRIASRIRVASPGAKIFSSV